MNSTEAIITAALSTLPSSHLSRLTHSISAVFHRHRRRLFSLLSSPILFSLTLRHLQSLSLHQKSLLIARHLFSNLTLLTHYFSSSRKPAPPSNIMKLRDLDAVLLLLLLCEVHQQILLDTSTLVSWRVILCDYVSRSMMTSLSAFGGCYSSTSEVLIQYIESIGRCWNLVSVMARDDERGKGGNEVAASVAAVVALPSVEVAGVIECVICKEEMSSVGGGREVCELPCNHLFHWMCILRWLKTRNTCPCCRHRLPTNDVRLEIERLLDDLKKSSVLVKDCVE